MKILMVNLFFYPYLGGTEKNILEISKELVKQGHSVTVLTAKLPNTKEKEIFNGINIIRIPSKIFYNLPHPFPPPYPLMHNFLTRYESLLKKEKFDIVHIHNRFCFGKKVFSIAKKQGAKTVLTIHNSRPKNIDFLTDFFGQAYDDFFGKKIMEECDGIIGVSKNALDITIPKNYNGKTKVIYNGCIFEKINPSKKDWKEFFEKKGLRGKMILANARLVKQKGLSYLIDAMEGINGAYLVIFGRGPFEKKLKKQAKNNNINCYFLTDKLSEEDLFSLYKSAYLFVLSSLYEPFGMVIIEAYSAKVPVIATDSGGPKEIVNNRTGYVVPIKDHKILAEKINELIINESRRNELSKNAYFYSKNFLWKKIAKETEDFYKSIIQT